MAAQSRSIEAVFSAALEIDAPVERADYLNAACGQDADFRRRVEALIQASADAGSFLEAPLAAFDATVDGMADETDAERTCAWATDLPFLLPCDKPGRLGLLRAKAGEFEVVEVVGHGGMGVVLRAFDSKLSRMVALKVMAPPLAANPTAVKRFLREAQAAASVHHDHVVTIFAVDDEHRPPFLVMEYIEGSTLAKVIERDGAIELVLILRIGSQIAAGLAAAHKLGLIHRDVKPSNILLENSIQRVKITDFGLARAADDLDMTQPGLVSGTPQYMSPEQAQGEAIDARSDLFSLGSVLYAMCTGRPAFRAATTLGVLRRVCDDAPRPIAEVNADIPPWLEAIVLKLLAKCPNDRFQSADEVADLLGRHLAHVNNPALAPRPASVEIAPVDQSARTDRGKRFAAVTTIALAGLLISIAALLSFMGFGPAIAAYQAWHGGGVGDSAGDGELTTSSVSTDLSERMRAMPEPFVQGNWRIEGDALVTEGIHKQSQIIVFGDPAWTDYDFKVEVIEDLKDELGEKPMANSIVVLADEHGAYRWHVDLGAFKDSKDFDLVPFVPSEDGWKSSARRWMANRLHGRTGVWYAVEVQVRHAKIKVNVDGETVATTEHPDLHQGRVGAGSFHVGRARWRNFEVRTPAGELLWQGLPALSAAHK